jgi:hypothetical protein
LSGADEYSRALGEEIFLMSTDKKPFRREDIPGISPELCDMVDPFGAAEQLGVDVRDLAAFLIRDGAKNVMLNDFYVAKKDSLPANKRPPPRGG